MDLRKKACLYFRNNWGIKVNLLYWLHLQYARLLSKSRSFTQTEKEVAKQAWEKGYAKLCTLNVDNLATKVAEQFDKIEVTNGCGALPRNEVCALAEPLYQAVKQFEQSVGAYYKSYFRINWIDIQKIVPGVQPKGSSFSYHIDDSPFSLAKVFIYLTDTYQDNGAFRAFNYEWTDKFLRKGLLNSSQPGAMRDSCQSIVSEKDEEALNVIEGVRGTAFIFDNNLAHKGTLPNKGCRMHVSMEIMPATREITLDDIVQACSRIPEDNYSPKPFSVKATEPLLDN